MIAVRLLELLPVRPVVTIPLVVELLEPKGMVVNTADVDAFRKLAQEKIWPAYQKQFPELWDEIVKTEA